MIKINRFIFLLVLFLAACSGDSKNSNFSQAISSSSSSQIDCTTTTANPDSTMDTKKIMRYLSLLSCDQIQGVISGQNAGHGNQLVDSTSVMGYQHNVQPVIDSTGFSPAILGIDYEHDEIFTLAELTEANTRLIEHAQAGGIVTINWAPLSPWLNAGNDPINKPGTWADTRTSMNATYVKLKDLVNPESEIRQVWLRRLDHVATALTQLRDANVTVLWRPLQEMNATHFWWGATEPLEKADDYIAIWQDMYRYFTETKKLNNLLWVFSPQPRIQLESGAFRGAMWAYPGDAFVDIIAPTAYNADLEISEYSVISSNTKPIAMAEYGPPGWGINFMGELPDALPTFDALRYTRLLKDYPRVAYWISWHSYPFNETHLVKLSLGDSKNLPALFENPQIINLQNIEISD
jgi:mannan endo-1,4-beta-mannosidase